MSSKVVNSVVSDNLFGTNGSVLSGQPSNNKTLSVGGIYNGGLVPGVDSSEAANSASRNIGGYDKKTTVGTPESTVAVGGNTSLVFDGNTTVAIKKGSYISTSNGTVAKIQSYVYDGILDKTSLVVSVDKTTYDAAAGVVSAVHDNPVGIGVDGVYSAIGQSNSLNGSADNSLLGGALGPFKAVNDFEAIRTTKTATAIRDGLWNPTTGKFSTAPDDANDKSTVGSDTSIGRVRVVTNVGGSTKAITG